MPSNTSAGFLIGICSLVLGFAAVWHIVWLTVASLVAALVVVVAHSFGKNDGYYISADEVAADEEKRYRALAAAEVN